MKPSLISVILCSAAFPVFADANTDVLTNYANIAEAAYGDALSTARTMQVAVNALIANPSAETQQAAKTAWLAARVPYLQTEVFRFGNPIVDAWEGQVNTWPLDEGLIDYVDVSYGGATEENAFAALNVIGTPNFVLSGTDIDATTITPDLISKALQAADGVDTNVSTGYHAIEFLLWGQDLNGTGPGAGARPFTDYALGEDCTNGNCDRRAQYLQAATDLLVSDLEVMAANWAVDGPARASVMANADAGILTILTGMGSLSYGELAGERMKLGLMLNDPEEEMDCFSDNTHNSQYYDGLGVQNVYLGHYTRTDGTTVSGPAVADLVATKDPALNLQLTADLATTMAALGAMKAAADTGMTYDQMIAPGNAEGAALITASVDGLVAQTASVERAVAALGVGAIALNGSDSLDNPDAVFQ